MRKPIAPLPWVSCSSPRPTDRPSRRPRAPGDPDLPAPGTRGNPDNVPFIGRRDPKGNPVRLARATGHVSNYTEEKVRALHAARPPGHGERRARHQRRAVVQGAPPGDPEVLPGRDLRPRPGERAQGDLGGGRDRPGRPRRHGGHEARGRQDGRQAGRPADEPDGLPPGQGERAGAGAPEHHLRLRPARGPAAARRTRRPSRGRPPRNRPPQGPAPADSIPWARCSAAAGGTPRWPTPTSSRTAPTAGPRASSGSR